MTQHTVHRFEEELEDIRNRVMAMGGLAEEQLGNALDSLLLGDSVLADTVRENENHLNRMDLEIHDACSLLLARRTPVAVDLRLVLSAVKIVNDLERIGDESKAIAQIALDDSERMKTLGFLSSLEEMGVQVKRMMRETLDALARLDTQGAVALREEDRKVNSYYGAILDNVVSVVKEKGKGPTDILYVCRATHALERIGDHCRNIGEHVIYLVQGEDVRHPHVRVAEE